MYNLQKIKDILSSKNENHLLHGKEFSKQMIIEAKNGNIEYFRETLDKLSDDDIEDLFLNFSPETYLIEKTYKNENSISEILKCLIIKSISDYDDKILRYLCEENVQFIQNKAIMEYYLREVIFLMIDLSMFDMVKILINSFIDFNFFDYRVIFEKCCKEESLSKIEFMFEIFDIPHTFIIAIMLQCLSLEKFYSFKFLFRTINKNNFKEESIDEFSRLLNLMIEENSELSEIEKDNFKSQINNVSEEMFRVIIGIFNQV